MKNQTQRFIQVPRGIYRFWESELGNLAPKPDSPRVKSNNSMSPKGQLISKGLFDGIVWTKKPTIFLRISALASKKRLDQKNKGTLYNELGAIYR